MELETQIECPFMATAGEVVELPGGERIVFVKTAAETGGELLEMEAHYTPGRRPPPEHYHPHQEERFTGITGKMAARVGGTTREQVRNLLPTVRQDRHSPSIHRK